MNRTSESYNTGAEIKKDEKPYRMTDEERQKEEEREQKVFCSYPNRHGYVFFSLG
ncbi:hypothetical protein [Candidatus Liberibacter sp.]|uniref:hypothetical protein n=1 Tax=Candidatus Liberibacter sp. TaxID=34022 RepID=UPI0015F65EEE|nr:hypothetical protein [Candidatus Liberibacter sp.]MBA5724072.1 hypothetical protein [Candidatus Liberibacter sp.]